MKIYHTETQADYDALMVELEAQGFMWSFGRKLSESNNWHVSEHLTCIRVYDSEVDYASLNYYKEEYSHIPITKYKAKADEKMRFTKENVIKLTNEWIEHKIGGSLDLQDAIMNLDDTPEKVVVPKFVAEWIELCKEKANLIDCLQGGYRHFNGCEHIGEDEDWLFEGNNQDVVARAWLYGYEVEKEPLYRIELPAYDFDMTEKINRPYSIFLGQNIETGSTAHYVAPKPHTEIKMLFNEAEIKAIDERYWAFAVPVGDKHENNE